MNRFYLIIPVVLLALFGGVYWNHIGHSKAESRAKAAAAFEAKAAEEAKKAEAERKAREDAEKRSADRLAEEKKKEADKLAKWEADNAQIAADTERYETQVKTLAAEAAALEKQIADVRTAKQLQGKENFELAREIELARIAKRNAEMEIQRTTEMLARSAGAGL